MRFFLVVCLLMCFQGFAQAETIYYNIYSGFKGGEATLKIEGEKEFKGKKTILIVFKAKGFNFYDEENIYLDPKSFKPLFVERIYNKEKISEDYVTDKGKIKITKTVGSKVTEQTLSNAKDVENIYGFIYRYRKTGSFKVGDRLDLNLPTKDLKIQLMKQTPLEISGKNYDTFYMQSVPAKYKIWFEANELKVPVRISSVIGVLNTSMIMTKYEK